MDSYFSLPGLQMPFQRRLSRLYNDTKKSSDFVKEPLQNAEDPEIKALQRKLRIQKDRLVSWGLEWSDPSQSSSEVLIDSSLSRAGLSEVVGSIMSTIKDTLAEVEPLWLSSKRLVGGGDARDNSADKAKGAADREWRDRKQPVVAWDKARFADLVRDLTVSIDTLYDLSRTRSSATTTMPSSKLSSWSPKQEPSLGSPMSMSMSVKQQLMATEEAKLYESSRMQVPQLIDSGTLTSVDSCTQPPEEPQTREVVFMSKQAYAELAPQMASYSPLLLEYAYFDPVFSTTGIMPSMARFEKLSAGLQGSSQRLLNSWTTWTGVPQLLGYFEDMEHSRLGLVYQLPPSFNAIVYPEGATQTLLNMRSCLYSLGDLLGSPGFEPKLEARFRLAFNLANAVFEMHAKGVAHGNLVAASILFGRVHNPESGVPPSDVSQVDIRKPLISSFDLFPDTPSPSRNAITRRSSQLHQHPLNPISFAPGAPPIVDVDPRVFDLYSLAMLLLSIGMWTRLENLVPHQDSEMVSEAVLEQLSTQCGTLYMKAVQTCWNAIELVVSAGKAAGDSHLARLQVRASSYLEACCVLDDVSALEDRLRNDLGGDDILESTSTAATPTAQTTTPTASASAPPAPMRAPTPTRIPTPTRRSNPSRIPTPTQAPPAPLGRARSSMAAFNMASMSMVAMPLREKAATDFPSHAPPPAALDTKQAPPLPPKTSVSEPVLKQAADPAATTNTKPERTRVRLYPQVPLPPDVVEKWHTFLMPQVNYALRHFYRSHPESVEISLESVGDSPRSTRPTVVVVCTSVSKVRAILKRKMGTVFEGANGIGLKVCSGRVMRSRKSGAVKRSQGSAYGGDSAADASRLLAANNQFQQKPQNGASIGAWIGDRHLPPVSFGGLVLVDDKPFGMTVHHMLDDPDEALEAVAARDSQKALRSSGRPRREGEAGEDAAAAADDDDDAQEVEELGQSVLDWYAELQAEDSSGASSSGGDDDYACEFSDTSSVSESDVTSEYWSDSDEDEEEGRPGGGDHAKQDADGDEEVGEPGDVPGVEPGYGDGYVVTQPALDDVDGNFYPDEATQDDDHLDSCGLGDVYASSGVRRRVDEHGLVHEIDWALFAFKEERLPAANAIPHLPLAGAAASASGGGGSGGRSAPSSSLSRASSASLASLLSSLPPSSTTEGTAPSDSSAKGVLRPTTVAPASALPGLEVQCMARTSGLQTGRILPTLTSVKIYGRASPSHTYQISAAGASASALAKDKSAGGGTTHGRRPIGIPGDSGAWIVEREHGRLCGHVLAWSERKRVAYLCPMDVLLLDIAETLEAGEVRLPGGEAVVKIMDAEEQRRSKEAAAAAANQAATAAASRSGLGTLNMQEGWGGGGGGYREHAEDGREAEEDEGFQDSEAAQFDARQHGARAGGSSSSANAKNTQGKGGRWQESTKMMEIVGSMGKVRLGGGSDVQAPC